MRFQLEEAAACSPVLVENRRFLIKLAQNASETEAAMRLRYQVFRVEQGRMPGVPCNGLDRDEYDGCCRHLLAVDRSAGRVIGTYRILPGTVAAAGIGFYSEREYRFRGLRGLMPQVFEVGRACVAPEYRSGAAVALLWAGIAELRRRCGFRYMLGCVSLEHTDAAIGWRLYRQLEREGRIGGPVAAVPRPGFGLPQPEEGVPEPAESVKALPPLFKGYLRIGAKFCGVPALDREFGSIDFPVWFDFGSVPERYAKHFNVQRAGE